MINIDRNEATSPAYLLGSAALKPPVVLNLYASAADRMPTLEIVFPAEACARTIGASEMSQSLAMAV